MDLDEYLWRNKRTLKELCSKVDCTPCTMNKIKHRRSSPKLVLALKLVEETGGQVSLKELLGREDEKRWKIWIPSR